MVNFIQGNNIKAVNLFQDNPSLLKGLRLKPFSVIFFIYKQISARLKG